MSLTAHAGPVPTLDAAQSVPAAVASPLTATFLDACGLRALDATQWQALSVAALVENPFYARRYVLAGLDTVDQKVRVRALSFTTASGELVGLFPYSSRSKVPQILPVANAAANDFQFSGMPLVHRDHAAEVVAAWLDMMQRHQAPGLWAFTNFDTGSKLAELMLDGALTRGMTALAVNGYERAFLTRLPGGLEQHMREAVSKSRASAVKRTIKRLREKGELTYEHVDEPVAFAQRLEQFLKLEDSGWKHRGGTSMLSDGKTVDFARAAFGPSRTKPAFTAMDSLLLNGEPIAMRLSIRAGGTAFTPKSAYDETYSKLGPGMALHSMLVEHFYGQSEIEAIDAAATVSGNSALNFYNERKQMATLILGASAWQARLLALLHREREVLKQKVKKLLKQE
jgi:CelD/BcsL family acetyltransferase involved in cellulose biosynthesis